MDHRSTNKIRQRTITDGPFDVVAMCAFGVGFLLAKPYQYVIPIMSVVFKFTHWNAITTPAVAIQLRQGFNYLDRERIQMDVAHQFCEIGFLIADNRLITVLPQALRAYTAERNK